MMEKWRQGKLYWYEVRTNGSAAGNRDFNPSEIYEEFTQIPFLE
jgi:hypothetical protein